MGRKPEKCILASKQESKWVFFADEIAERDRP